MQLLQKNHLISCWCTNINHNHELSESLNLWLTKTFMLSKYLRACCRNLAVELVSQDWQQISSCEQSALHTTRQENCLVRKVNISGDNTPWVYARSIFPKESYEKHKIMLDNLKNNLMGENILYTNNAIVRSTFEFKALRHYDELYQEVLQSNPQLTLEKNIIMWARRSMFNWFGAKLILTEVLLPSLPQHPGV